MSDDLGKKIKQITDLLGQDTVADGVKSLLSMLGNSSAREETPQSAKPAEPLPAATEADSRSEADSTIDMVRKVKKVMDNINCGNDPRVNLLNALRPYLNKNRQKRLNSCMKILSITSLSRFIDDEDLSSLFK
jgi:hypothetical protein